MTRHLLFLAVSATLGVTAHSNLSMKLLICILFFLCFLFYWSGGKWKVLILHIVIMGIFISSASITEIRNKSIYDGSESHFLVTFTSQPKLDGNLLKGFVTSEQGEQLLLRYTIASEQEKEGLNQHLRTGISCPIQGSLQVPEPHRNENSFDYQQYLSRQNTHWIVKADSISFSKCKMSKASLVVSIRNFRMKGISYIKKHFPKESSGFVTALIFGDQSEIDEEDLTNYQRLGLVHLLAISGLHVSLLTGMLFYLGIRIGITRERMIILILVFLPMYTLLSGGSPSVMRSCLMAMLFFILMLFKKRLSASVTIGVIYLVLLFLQPNMIYNIGFQLSFAVTFSIIMSSGIFLHYPQKIMQLLIISTSCQLAALPILLFHFYEVSLLGVLLNVLYVPLYSVILLPFSLITVVVNLLVPALGHPLITLLNVTFTLCNRAADLASDFPLASVSFGKPGFIMLLFLLVSILGLFVNWETSFRASKAWWGMFILLLLLQFNIQKLSPFGEVQIIDIGQGDSILITLPFNAGNYLIDTGGQITFPLEEWKKKRKIYNTAEDTIIPLLKSKGIHHLDKLILTHADADHMGSAKKLIENFKVEEVIIGSWGEEQYRDKDFIPVARDNGIRIKMVKRGDSWSVGEAKFYVLNPHKKEENTNEASVVLYAEIGGLSWVFTGDMSEPGEMELIDAFPQLRADILKVGHHGSKTSSSIPFLEQLHPKAAIISVGKENRYGHPHGQVLESMKANKIMVFRTDEDGAVIYKYTKKGGTFRKILP
ncbi:DNA internalization-related competence protein ComEC/Rec2 [Peribacillus sp. NPDC097206]|uniref:DNA internalization-related competence protein ComEC/Rec2 n=1 Tax=Peribacillus sp. NPDC097206 TaxID=3364398 RepID=UPI00382A5CCE